MIARLTAATLLAGLVTATLLYAMQTVVSSGSDAAEDRDAFRLGAFARAPEQDAPEQRRQTRPDRPPRPAMRPASLLPATLDSAGPGLPASVTAPKFMAGAAVADGFAVGDTELYPIVKVAPAYPQMAVARDLEGYVIIEFTVTTAGTVRDISVIESSAPVLEASAIKAALRFEYQPRVIGGEPVEVTGVMNKIVFELTEPQRMAMRL